MKSKTNPQQFCEFVSQLYNQKSDSAFLNELKMKANNLVINIVW